MNFRSREAYVSSAWNKVVFVGNDFRTAGLLSDFRGPPLRTRLNLKRITI